MSYVDGFVLAVPNDNKKRYIEHAKQCAEVFKKNGAIRLVECWGDDVPQGKTTSFPMAVKCKDNETVVLSWIIWPSKKARDTGMEKCMQDPVFQTDNKPMPFDGKRMIFGGFQMVVEI